MTGKPGTEYSGRPPDPLLVLGRLAAQRGQAADGFACSFFGEAEVVQGLRIEPELRTCAEEVAKPEGRVTGDGAPAVEDCVRTQIVGSWMGRKSMFWGEMRRVRVASRHGKLASWLVYRVLT